MKLKIKGDFASWVVFCFVFTAVFLSGCAVVPASEVSSSTVHADYAATYDEQGSNTSYSAHFTVGGDTGTVIELDKNSAVEIDGQSMADEHDLVNDVYYESRSASSYEDYQSNHEFYFRDQSGDIFRNDFQFPVMVEIAGVSNPNPSRFNDFTVAWVVGGPMESPMDSGDTLEAVMVRSDGAAARASANPYGATNGSITIPSEALQTLGSSSVQLSICHHHTTFAIQGDSSGGDLESTACSRTVNLNLQ